MRDKLYKAAYKFIGILNLHEKIIQAPCCSDSPVGCCTYPPYKQCEPPSLYLQSGSVSQVGKLVFFYVLLHLPGWRCRAPIEGGEYRPIYIGNRSEGISDNLCKFVYFQQSCEKTNVGIIKKTYKKYPNGLTYK